MTAVQTGPPIPPRDLSVRFYETDDALFEATGRYLREGLDRREGMVVVATPVHLAGFERVLTAGQVDVAAAKARGQLVALDAEQTLSELMVGSLAKGRPDPAAFTRVVGGVVERAMAGGQRPGLRVYGEMVDVLFRLGNPAAAVELERLWNDLADTRPFRLSCAYLLHGFDRAAIQDQVFRTVCQLHSSVVLHTAAPGDGDSPEGGALRGLPTSTQRGHGKRVLVVDDNVDFALSFAELLRHLGCEVAVAHDGPAALAMAREWKPAIALLDIGLPGMDGFELARRLRQTADHPMKLIAVTGYDQERDRARSRDAGFDVHVAKPVDLKAVPALLELALS